MSKEKKAFPWGGLQDGWDKSTSQPKMDFQSGVRMFTITGWVVKDGTKADDPSRLLVTCEIVVEPPPGLICWLSFPLVPKMLFLVRRFCDAVVLPEMDPDLEVPKLAEEIPAFLSRLVACQAAVWIAREVREDGRYNDTAIHPSAVGRNKDPVVRPVVEG